MQKLFKVSFLVDDCDVFVTGEDEEEVRRVLDIGEVIADGFIKVAIFGIKEVDDIKDVTADWQKDMPYNSDQTCEEYFEETYEERMAKLRHEEMVKNHMHFDFHDDVKTGDSNNGKTENM